MAAAYAKIKEDFDAGHLLFTKAREASAGLRPAWLRRFFDHTNIETIEQSEQSDEFLLSSQRCSVFSMVSMFV